MNFQHLSPVDSSTTLLNLAFRRAREQGIQKNLTGNWLQIIRRKEGLKLDIIKEILVSRLEKILQDFPQTEKLLPFYQELLRLTLDFPQFKKSLGGLNWAVQKIKFFHREYVRKIAKEKSRERIGLLSKQFYGRISSVVKQIQENLQFLEQSRLIMRTYPDIKEMFTVCIYGFPNVGKTTLLNALTGTKAKVASYAFTTTTINVGYCKVDGRTIQVLDVPGTLARQDKLNLIERQAELALARLAHLIIYVFDVSGQGYSLHKQEELYEKIKHNKNVIIYVSKTDLLTSEVLNSFKHQYYNLKEIKEHLASAAEKFERTQT